MITYVKALIICMFSFLYREAPAIEHSQKARHIQHREDVQVLGDMFVDTGSRGYLVSKDIDPLFLAGMSWEESRYRQHGPDGDPIFKGGLMICTKPGPCYGPRTPRVRIGNSVGPMQISRAAPYWVKIWEDDNLPEGKLWHGLTLKRLRDPATNIAFAYSLLGKYKRDCGGSPAVWIDSYGRGKCTPGHTYKHVGRKAKKRCKNVDKLVKKMSELYPEFEVPKSFACMTWTPPAEEVKGKSDDQTE